MITRNERILSAANAYRDADREEVALVAAGQRAEAELRALIEASAFNLETARRRSQEAYSAMLGAVLSTGGESGVTSYRELKA